MRYVIDWGDVPGWLQLIGVVGGVVFALWQHRSTIQDANRRDIRATEEFLNLVEGVAKVARKAIPAQMPSDAFHHLMVATNLDTESGKTTRQLLQTPLIHWPGPRMFAEAGHLLNAIDAATTTLKDIAEGATASAQTWKKPRKGFAATAFETPAEAYESARHGVVECAEFLIDQCEQTRSRLGLVESTLGKEEDRRTTEILQRLRKSNYA